MNRSTVETGYIGSSPSRQIERVELRTPLLWFRAGVSDIFRMPLYTLTCGALLSALAYGATEIAALPASISLGYLAMLAIPAGFVAGALCSASRQLNRDRATGVTSALRQLWQSKVHVGMLSLLVAGLALAWFRLTTLTLVLFSGSHASPTYSLLDLLNAYDGGIVIALLAISTLLAAILLFSVTVIALPLVIDGDEDFLNAMITSFQATSRNPIAMLWVSVVTLLTLGISAVWLPAVMLISPALAYATWHSYESLVKTQRPLHSRV